MNDAVNGGGSEHFQHIPPRETPGNRHCRLLAQPFQSDGKSDDIVHT